MKLAYGFPSLSGDPRSPIGRCGGISNRVNGEYIGPRFEFLKMQAVSGSIPQDSFLLCLSVGRHLRGAIEGAYKENRGIAYVLKVWSQTQFNRLLKMKTLCDATATAIKEHVQ